MTLNGYSDIVAISNIDQYNDIENPVFDDAGGDPAYTGVSVTTGADGDYQITGISLAFGSHADPSGDFTLQLYSSDNANSPETLLHTFIGETNPDDNSVEAYTYDDGAGNGYDIEANTTYWLIASVQGGDKDSEYAWKSTEGVATSDLGWSLGMTTEINSDLTTDSTFTDSPMLSISVKAIPEPATLGLISLVGISALAFKRFLVA
jgi:hypothetical protein